MLYCSNRASICSHALILLSQTRWIVMTGWRTSISLQPMFKHVRIVVFKHQFPPCVSNMSRLWILVCAHASVPQLCVQTRLGCDFLFVYKHLSPALCFKHVWIVVPCLSTSPVFQTRLNAVPCLCTHIRRQPFVSNTFDDGCLFVYKHQS